MRWLLSLRGPHPRPLGSCSVCWAEAQGLGWGSVSRTPEVHPPSRQLKQASPLAQSSPAAQFRPYHEPAVSPGVKASGLGEGSYAAARCLSCPLALRSPGGRARSYQVGWPPRGSACLGFSGPEVGHSLAGCTESQGGVLSLPLWAHGLPPGCADLPSATTHCLGPSQ